VKAAFLWAVALLFGKGLMLAGTYSLRNEGLKREQTEVGIHGHIQA
jgi:hypothetical protein